MTSSPDRAGALLLCFMAGCFLSGVPSSDAAWLALSIIPWALALAWVPELPWRPAFAAWAAWLGWSGVCALLSPEPWLSLVAWWRSASILISLALGAAWWSRRERRIWVLVLAAMGVLAAAGIFASRFSVLWPSSLTLPPGLWAAAGAAAAAGWVSGDEEGWSSAAWFALLIGAAATAFGAPWPALLALGAAGGWCAFCASRRLPGIILVLGAASGAAAHAAAWALWRPAEGWSLAATVLGSHPVLGVGPGLLGRELYRLAAGARGVQSFALGAGAETGYVGLALFAAAVAASIPSGFRRLDAAGRAAAGAFLVLVGYAFLADVPFAPSFLAALAATAAVGLSPGRLGEVRAADHGTPLRMQRWFTALGLIFAFAAAAPRQLLRRSLDEAGRAPMGEARVEALERAARLAPGDPGVHARLAEENLLLKPARVGEALRRIRLAAEADPANAVFRAQLAELWSAFGSLSRAALAARDALTLEPRFLSPRLILAEAAAAEGRRSDALALLAQARALRASWTPRAPRANGDDARGTAREENGRARAPRDPYEETLARWDEGREKRILEAVARASR